MNIDDILKKGNAAKTLLENPDFNIALDAVRLQAYKGFANSEPEQAAKREEHYYLLRAVEMLRTNLETLVENANFEMKKAEKNNPQQNLFGDDDE